MILGYIRPDARYPQVPQFELLQKFGAVRFYVESERRKGDAYPQLAALLRAVRPGDEMAVADFHRLASNSPDLKANFAAIRERKVVVIEARTKRRSDCQKDLLAMTVEAQAMWSGRQMDSVLAKELGAKGGAASAPTNRREPPMPLSQIQAIMDDHVTYPTVHRAISAINYKQRGANRITLGTIYRWNREGKFATPLTPRISGPKSKPK